MPKIEIDGEIVECLTEVIAEKGQKLLIVNGFCLGLAEDTLGTTITQSQRPMAAKAPVALPAIRQYLSFEEKAAIQEGMTKILLDGPATSREIANKLKLSKKERSFLHWTVHDLCQKGFLQKLDDSRYPQYMIKTSG